MSVSNSIPTMAEVQRMIEPFRHPNTSKALWQLANTLIPYFGLWAVMIYTLKISYWLTLPIAILAGGFLIRIFIIFHDCGHQSFFPSRKANRNVGFLLGLFALTPSEHWWRSHAIHHATNGNLDKRGMGDVETLTVDEYQNSSLFKKISYRIFRFPPIMFGLGPFFHICYWTPVSNLKAREKSRLECHAHKPGVGCDHTGDESVDRLLAFCHHSAHSDVDRRHLWDLAVLCRAPI